MSWFLAFAGFAVLIILHELGHFAVAKWVGMRVERFSLFFPPLIWRKKVGETEYAVGSIPLGGYVKITGMTPHEELSPEILPRAYYKQPVWKRIAVIAAGPAVNIALAFVLLWGFYMYWGVVVNKVDKVEPNLPAASVLEPGDQIVAVDGVEGNREELSTQISEHTCAGTPRQGCKARTPAVLTIRRGERDLTVRVTPVYDAKLKRPRVGFAWTQAKDDVGPGGAAQESVSTMWEVTSATVSTIVQIFDPAKREQISGIVGSYETTRQAVSFSTETAVLVLALISLSLAVINLFPFLPLDGGHIFWALAEKIRGKPIPFSIVERSGFVGFALVIFLFAIGLSNDIDTLRNGGFGFR